MNACITFSSERVHYALLQEEDAPLYLSLMMEKEIMEHITGKALSRKKAINRFKGVLHTNEQDNGFGTFGVYHKKEEKFMGIAKFVPTDDQTVEIGYALLKKYWGCKYGTEISCSLVDYAKSMDGITTLEALVSPSNIASKKILEKCSFVFFGKVFSNGRETEVYRLQLSDRS